MPIELNRMRVERPFKLRVTVRDGERAVRGVPCEVRLPVRASGPVELRLYSSSPSAWLSLSVFDCRPDQVSRPG